MIAIYYLPLHGLDAPANAFYPSQYNDLEYEAIFRPTFSIQFSPTGAEWGNAALFAP